MARKPHASASANKGKRKVTPVAEEQETKDIDAVDIVSFIGSLIGTTAAYSSTGTLAWGFIAMLGYWGQRKFRRSEVARQWAMRLSEIPQLETIAPTLLPGPSNEETAITLRQDKPLDVRVVGNELRDVDPYEDEPWWRRASRPAPGMSTASEAKQVFSGTARRGKASMMDHQQAYLLKSLKRLPKYINYTQLPNPPSKFAVPIGVESAENHLLWGDFSAEGNLIHALIAGQTGAGKDALLRLWFTVLTSQNTPQDLQFVILDGKIDWLSPALAESSYMAIPPAGGIEIVKEKGKYTNKAKERMAASMEWIFDEIQRRDAELKRYGAVDVVGYRKRSGKHLPYIFLICSDIGDMFDDDLELLVKILIARGRSYGIRLVVSLQNPVGENTRWRSQIGLVMSGYQQNSDHDRYIMGINVDRLLVRPSQLPNAEEDDRSKGLFIVRHGTSQHLVRTAHLPEDDWFEYIEQHLPKKRDADDAFLLGLLEQRNIPPQDNQITEQARYSTQKLHDEPKQPVLTTDQIKTIQIFVQQGLNKTQIMHAFKWTNGDIYARKSAAVDIIIAATKRKMAQQ